MSWLKRQQPIRLYQGSNIPYVILTDGVHLCCDNCYGIKCDSSEHNICFNIEATSIKRINTHFYRIASFPAVIPFCDIVALDDAVIEGRTIKQAADVQGDPKSIAIIKPEYIRHTADTDLTGLSDTLDEYDASFILIGENIDPQVRLFEDSSAIIHHLSWPRTLVTIADNVCEQTSRKYCWTQTLPELSVSCYGIDAADELVEIHEAFTAIGINDVSVNWVD